MSNVTTGKSNTEKAASIKAQIEAKAAKGVPQGQDMNHPTPQAATPTVAKVTKDFVRKGPPSKKLFAEMKALLEAGKTPQEVADLVDRPLATVEKLADTLPRQDVIVYTLPRLRPGYDFPVNLPVGATVAEVNRIAKFMLAMIDTE